MDPLLGPLLQLNFECLSKLVSNICDLSSGTRLTIQPPQPAPVNRDPTAPEDKATETNSSNFGCEHSYRSRQLRCDSFISSPNLLISAVVSQILRNS